MTFSTRRARVLLAACCLLPAPSAQAQTKPELAQPGGVALSPDGALVAWTLKTGEITTQRPHEVIAFRFGFDRDDEEDGGTRQLRDDRLRNG